jgi:hypothetical protein
MKKPPNPQCGVGGFFIEQTGTVPAGWISGAWS